jgi:hypothetical protein
MNWIALSLIVAGVAGIANAMRLVRYATPENTKIPPFLLGSFVGGATALIGGALVLSVALDMCGGCAFFLSTVVVCFSSVLAVAIAAGPVEYEDSLPASPPAPKRRARDEGRL